MMFSPVATGFTESSALYLVTVPSTTNLIDSSGVSRGLYSKATVTSPISPKGSLGLSRILAIDVISGVYVISGVKKFIALLSTVSRSRSAKDGREYSTLAR